MRFARRVDANHAEVKAAFEKMGCSVIDLSRMGEGVPDILAGYGGLCCLVEIKDGTKVPSARKLTKPQQTLMARWTGGARLVTCLDDVAAAVAWLRACHKVICASQGGVR